MTHVTVLGMVAGVMTTVSFLPQLFKVWRSKSASDLSFVMLFILNTGMLLWLIYGFLINDIAVIITHSVSLVLASMILVFKVKYQYIQPRRRRIQAEKVRTQLYREHVLQEQRSKKEPLKKEPPKKETLNSRSNPMSPLTIPD